MSIKHITNVRETNSNGNNWEIITYCNKTLSSMEWSFTDLEHASSSNQAGSLIRPCKNCVKKAIKILTES